MFIKSFEDSKTYDLDIVVRYLKRTIDVIPIQYEYNYEKGVSDGLIKALDLIESDNLE